MWQRTASTDLWRRTVSQIPSVFGRLVYLSSLRDNNSGQYLHDGLISVFGEEEASRALAISHERSFLEWLGFNLEQQKADLDLYLSAIEGSKRRLLDTWLKLTPYRNLIPASARDADRNLYLADLELLLEILRNEYAVSGKDRSA
ncbi:MAG: hypothetical protein FJW40_22290 [Acidobacteria bacterium]|nr:hypothetical protein [Acidobacteriota bacterium]